MFSRIDRANGGFLAVGIVFVVLGISQGAAFLAVGFAFLAVALGRSHRARSQRPEDI
jgi:hypothetical protein